MNTIRNDQDYANDLLFSEKQLCSSYTTAATESATVNIRDGLKNILSTQLDNQNEVFKAMSKNGWYPLDQAENTKIQQVKNTYSNTNM